jgi:hypothetical protein
VLGVRLNVKISLITARVVTVNLLPFALKRRRREMGNKELVVILASMATLTVVVAIAADVEKQRMRMRKCLS